MIRTLEGWKEFCYKRGTSGDMVSDILKDWRSEKSGRAVDDLSQALSAREEDIARLNQFLGLIARELGDKKWNELVDKFDQWRKKEFNE